MLSRPLFDSANLPQGFGLLVVIGDPIEHSLSPAMHSAAIQELGLPYKYVPLRVSAEDLVESLIELEKLGCVGANVTIPHKENTYRWLTHDRCDEEARAVQAVNTIHFCQVGPMGYSTDGVGFDAVAARAGITAEIETAVVVGAGGAARTVVYRLLKAGSEVVLINRSRERAEALANQMQFCGGSVTCVPIDDFKSIRSAILRADLLVQTTSVGMFPYVDETPISRDLLHPELTVIDLIYNPFETRLLLDSKRMGCKTANGVAMLVGQGAESFRRWTGVNPPVDVMELAVLKALGQSMRQ